MDKVSPMSYTSAHADRPEIAYRNPSTHTTNTPFIPSHVQLLLSLLHTPTNALFVLYGFGLASKSEA